MKKILIFFLSLTMIFTITACGSDTKETAGANTTETAIEATAGEAASDYVPEIEEGRRIADETIAIADLAGVFTGENFGSLKLAVYTEPENNIVGIIYVYDKDGTTIYTGEIAEIADNCYAMTYIDANFTIFTDSGDYCLDFYVDGEHADYFILTNPEQ